MVGEVVGEEVVGEVGGEEVIGEVVGEIIVSLNLTSAICTH